MLIHTKYQMQARTSVAVEQNDQIWVFFQYHGCSALNKDGKCIWERAATKLKSHISLMQESDFQVLRSKRSPTSASQRMQDWPQGSSSCANLSRFVSVQFPDQTCDTTGKLSNMRLTIKICQTTYVSMKHFYLSTYTFSNCISFVETFLLSSYSACRNKLYLVLLASKITISSHTRNRRSVFRALSRSFGHANRQGNSVTVIHQLKQIVYMCSLNQFVTELRNTLAHIKQTAMTSSAPLP